MKCGDFEDLEVTASELRKWPLVHGSLGLKDDWPLFRERGIRVRGGQSKGFNSNRLDAATGRDRYIFAQPFRISGGYGYGSYLLLNPMILNRPGVKCLLQDPQTTIFGHLLPAIMCYLEQGADDWNFEPGLLPVISDAVGRLAPKGRVGWSDVEREIVRRPAQLRALLGSLEVSANDFFSAIESRAKRQGLRFSSFVRRGAEWEEEILVPTTIGPEDILGLVHLGGWTPLSSAPDRETQLRVDRFLHVLSGRR